MTALSVLKRERLEAPRWTYSAEGGSISAPQGCGAMHWWLKIQLLSYLCQLPIKADQCSTAFTPGQVKGICKIHTLSVPLQGLPHQIGLLQMEMANGE